MVAPHIGARMSCRKQGWELERMRTSTEHRVAVKDAACRNRARRALLLAGVMSLAALPAMAEPVQFDIPAEDLRTALLAFGKQSKWRVTVAPEVVDRQAPAINGRQEPVDALKRLLGSDLTFEFLDATNVIVRPAGRQSMQAPKTSPRPSVAATAEVPPEELVVTGSRLSGVANGAVETRAYSLEKIEMSGQTSLTGFLATLPEVSVTQPFTSSANYGATASVQLRGLPVGTTLVLLDGQRLDTSALAAFGFDINMIPSALVERIEIVPVGSSAVYGSDALAGVVNIITKHKQSGFEVETTYADADHFRDRRTNGAGGYSWDSGYVSLGVSYQRRSGLRVSDRDEVASGDFRRYANVGGRDARTTACAPGSIASANGSALPGLSASTALVPANLNAPTIAAFLLGAGRTFLCNRQQNAVNPMTQYGALVAGEQQVGDVTAFGNMLYSRGRNRSDSDFGFPLTNRSVPASNFYNPFGQAILLNSALPIPYSYSTSSNFFRATAGIKGSLGGWSYRLYGTFIEDDASSADHSVVNDAALILALASNSATTALNPFNPAASAPSVLGSIALTRTIPFESSMTLAGGYVQRAITALPAGDVQFLLGGELERDRFLRGGSSAITEAARRSKAAFSELSIPLLSESWIGSLSTNIALRYNDYSDFGQRYVPQYSAQWSLTPEISFRASYSKSFRAPALIQLYTLPATGTQLTSNFPDPLNKGAIYSFSQISGGNPNLKPEFGRSTAFGATWKRADLFGMELNATYFRTQESNRIVTPNGPFIQVMIDNPNLLPGRVIRDASGRIASVNTSFSNFGNIDVAGIDLDVSFRLQSRWGEFRPSLSVSQFTKYKAVVTPGTATVDRLGKATAGDVWAPRTRGTLGLAWSHDAYRANLAARYIGRYVDYPGTNSLTTTIGGYTFFDGSFEIDLTKLSRLEVFGSKSYLRFTGSNLLDRKPQYSNFNSGTSGFDPLEDDIIGRLLGISFGIRW
jgi:iron complex outermembrane receptor protein